MLFPLVVGGVAIIASIIGTFFIRLSGQNIMGALYKGLIATGVISAVAFWFLAKKFFPEGSVISSGKVFFDLLVGLGLTG